jgi:hypothetical protein
LTQRPIVVWVRGKLAPEVKISPACCCPLAAQFLTMAMKSSALLVSSRAAHRRTG